MFEILPFGTPDTHKKVNDNFRRLIDLFDDPFDSLQKLNPISNDIKVDVKETDTAYEIHADLPGISKENVELKYENDYLTIAVRQEENKEDKNEDKYIRKERRSSYTSRSFYATDIDRDNIAAELKDGILKVTLPKKEPAKETKTTIAIN